MEKPVYPINTSQDGYWYTFESISDEKIIKKAVGYYSTKDPNMVELSFGDIIADGQIDVKAISNNNDMPSILGTVIQTLYRFFELYPQKSVVFSGSSFSRNRLYRAIISKLLAESTSSLDVFGVTYEDQTEKFISNKDYFSFQIKLKQ